MSQPNPVKKYLPIVATIIVVVGIVLIVKLAPQSTKQPLVTKTDQVVEQPAASSTVVAQGSKGFMVVNQLGKARPCEWPEGFSAIDRVSREGVAIRSATGARMLVDFDCVIKNSKLVPGLANPSGNRAVKVAGKRLDGAGVVEISDGKFTEEITLRGKNSRPYREPEIVGWLDENIVAILAMQGDTRRVLFVQTTGRVTEFLKLPENAAEMQIGDGAFWYVTFTPGEGIEVGPRGPSEFHRVSLEGRDEVVAREEGAVIENARIGPQGRVAYLAGGTLMLQMADGKFANVGTGQPFGWSQDGALLVRRGSRLFAIGQDGAGVDLGIAIDDASAAWQLRQE